MHRLHPLARTHAVLALIISGLMIVGCGQSSTRGQREDRLPAEPSSSEPTTADLDGMDAFQALAVANEWRGNEVTSYVTANNVNFEFPGGDAMSISLPGDKMVVAIAPYVHNTHPCETHYISGCQGELVNVRVDIVAQLPDGSLILDETMRTMANGFVELWLPRNQEIFVTIEAQGKSAQGIVSTQDNGQTCVTSFQLL